jgi:hypothetical protein
VSDARRDLVKLSGDLVRQNKKLLDALRKLRDTFCTMHCCYYRVPDSHHSECLDATAAIQIAEGR